MIAALRRRWSDTTQAWLLARQGRDSERAVLQRGRIYILPTAFGFVYALFVFGLLLGSMNYTNSMGFILTFLLGALGLLAMHHTHRNLLGLVIDRGRVDAPFAGQQAVFTLHITNPSDAQRWAIGADSEAMPSWFADIEPRGSALLPLPVDAPRRGPLVLPSARVYTRYPFGLFHAWAVLHMDLRVIVYPKPASTAPPVPMSGGDGRGTLEARGQDDFAGLRDYRAGESPRQIAWKAFARDEQLRSKQFSGALQATPWFEFDALDGMETEERLSVLCRWVIDAERDGMRYGLRLPGTIIAPATGDAHRRECLEALALFEAER